MTHLNKLDEPACILLYNIYCKIYKTLFKYGGMSFVRKEYHKPKEVEVRRKTLPLRIIAQSLQYAPVINSHQNIKQSKISFSFFFCTFISTFVLFCPKHNELCVIWETCTNIKKTTMKRWQTLSIFMIAAPHLKARRSSMALNITIDKE